MKLTFLFTFAFGMKRSSCLLLSMFLQCWALHLPETFCVASLRTSKLLKLRSSPELWRWSKQEMRCENEVTEVGGEKNGVKNRVQKTLGRGRGFVLGSSPKWLERPHPELVHWWLLVYSSQVLMLNHMSLVNQMTIFLGYAMDVAHYFCRWQTSKTLLVKRNVVFKHLWISRHRMGRFFISVRWVFLQNYNKHPSSIRYLVLI